MRTILSAIFVSALFMTAPHGAFAAGGYIQASSEEDQIVKDANKPQLVTMKSTDAAKGIKNNNGVVILDQTGTYFTIVGVQVGSRGGTGLVRLWFQTNGKDADNTNCEQLISDCRIHHRHDLAGGGRIQEGRQGQCDDVGLCAGHWSRLQEAGRRTGGTQRDLLGLEDRLSRLGQHGGVATAPPFFAAPAGELAT